MMLNSAEYWKISTHILTKRMTEQEWRCAKEQYFNSHPHEEDDHIKANANHQWGISTHILTKRMTESNYYVFKYWSISTHILTKRMTNFVELKNLVFDYFNSHPHEEDDCHNTLSPFLLYSYFNSHPHEEDD